MNLKILLLDTCGEVGSVALGEGGAILATEALPARGSSSAVLPAIARLLELRGWGLAELDGVSVVGGPGSFTGVRVGLAAAKGLCEATGLKLAVVSRLAVLAGAASLVEGLAVVDAGRGEFYVLVRAAGQDEREVLLPVEELAGLAAGKRVAVCEPRLMETLATFAPELSSAGPEWALPLALQSLAAGGDDVALADANYVRSERDIYGKMRMQAAG